MNIHPQTLKTVQELRSKADFLEAIGQKFPDHHWTMDDMGNVRGTKNYSGGQANIGGNTARLGGAS